MSLQTTFSSLIATVELIITKLQTLDEVALIYLRSRKAELQLILTRPDGEELIDEDGEIEILDQAKRDSIIAQIADLDAKIAILEA